MNNADKLLKIGMELGRIQTQFEELKEENKKLKDKIYKIEELVDAYEKAEEIIGVGKPRFPLYKLQKILGE